MGGDNRSWEQRKIDAANKRRLAKHRTTCAKGHQKRHNRNKKKK